MVIKPRHILWPTDFSALAEHGARYVRGFCELFGADLHVIHVAPAPLGTDVAVALPTGVPVPFVDDDATEECAARLTALVAQHFPTLPTVTTRVLVGTPWKLVCDYAQEAEIDLMVIATHGRTGLQHVLIGSTAERIVQHAPCPVLVVKNPEKDFVAG